jgi:alpha-glucosidase
VSGATPWWRGAVLYQIYVRSFADGNGDGIGDFAGLRSKLDYVASLGVDAVWLSPIHPTPNRDWGYDVSDYNTVNPEFGSDGDFDRLLAEAQGRGLKVLIDEVLAHTSDEHPWFRASLEDDEKAGWYVWAPPRDDGTAPNNWLSAFGGPAWSYHPSRRQCYHHKFLRQQPKLNWREPAAREAALRVLDRWLDRGVDGFRLDVANAFLHDALLADNPSVPDELRTALNWSRASYLQYHRHDSNLPENLEVLDEIRRRVERYRDRFVMGEFSEEPDRCGGFASTSRGLHSGYTFPLLEARQFGPAFVREHYEKLARYPGHWPSVAPSNHDVVRTVTRFGGKDAPPALARLMLALLVSLRGSPILYQGEELGLPEAELRRNQLKDPVGDLYYPLASGRDGCRTPMPWDDSAPNLGFTLGTPWLPLSPLHRELAVSNQERDPCSTLSYARKMLSERKAIPALRHGDIQFLDGSAAVLAFLRIHAGERILCVFNMSTAEASFRESRIASATPLALGSGAVSVSGSTLTAAPYAAWFARV